MEHLGETEIAAFWQGILPPSRRLRVLRHLLAGCFSCRTRLKAAAPELFPGEGADDLAAYEDSLRSAERAAVQLMPSLGRNAVDVERELALLRQKGLPRSEGDSPDDRWVEVEAKLRRAFELRYTDPAAMLDLSERARNEAEGLAPNAYGRGFLFDLRARAWADFANACRVNELYDRADAALVEARRRWESGSGDAQLAAYLDELESALRRSQWRFQPALRLLSRAYRAYCLIGDNHLAGRTLVSRSYCLGLLKRPAESLAALRQALGLLDVSQDSQLFAVAQQNLLDALVEAGRYAEAGRFLLESGLRQKLGGDPLNLLRVRWVEAKLLAARDNLAAAERAFAEVREGFRVGGLAYDEALAGLDLAGVLLRRGKQSQAHALARELYTDFVARHAQTEAANALMIFEVACGQRRATADLAVKVRRVLAKAHARPAAAGRRAH